MEEPWRHYAKWNKLVKKRQILNDSTDVKDLEQSNSYRQKVEWWLPGARREDGELVFNGYRIWVWEDEKVLNMGGSGIGYTAMWM